MRRSKTYLFSHPRDQIKSLAPVAARKLSCRSPCDRIKETPAVKLFWSNASPYARKVRMLIAERGLGHLVEETAVDVSADPPELIAANPLGKIPTLLTDDGAALFDSPVICAYLDAHPEAKGASLLPTSGPERSMALRGEAYGDALMDLGLLLMAEKRKPEGEKSPTLAGRQRGQLLRALDAAPQVIGSLPQSLTVGHLAFVAALGYLDYRHPELAWRDGRAELAAWFAAMSARPSAAATAPV
jgi:glutathione S-transferase